MASIIYTPTFYACQIASGKQIFPCLGYIISGGHTNLFKCSDAITFEHLGGTIDDAAGEAFDKVATMLGFPYPGGPQISKAAQNGNPKAYRFPRTFLNEPDRLQFSFSGLKTAVLYELLGPGNSDLSQIDIDDQKRADVAASFEQAVVDCLVGKALSCDQADWNETGCALEVASPPTDLSDKP